ncbi:defense protein l(2)34Fc-like [Littorina saxatilis]|uniref:Reelin domain-containing protein n=1 Tax=Littorina saxatilis TaxID=31220 RepID=A0AAN9GIT1_9CAEN
MHPKRQVLHVLAALLLVTVVSSFPSGAPLSACGHLMPIHEDAVAEESASPFLILLSSTNYTTQEPITVTVTSGEPYLAFMLQGRTRDNSPVGRFSVAPPVSKFLSCYGANDTLSHAAAYGRTAMEVTWHPPTEDVGDVFITGSIARTKYIFWAVESEAIKGKDTYVQPSGGGNGANTLSSSSNVAVTVLSLLLLSMRHFIKLRC